MNGNKIVLDTNIVLYLLGGDKELFSILNGIHLFVSVITEIELLGFNGISESDRTKISSFLSNCTLIPLNNEIKEICIDLKQKSKSKTPDAIVAASALFLGIPLITADKGFEKIDNLDLFLYQF
ncbi:type II toxin-antitoxin system VapC family toxin [Flavobacterium sp.]|uniref:type II toxin-antitoxin system VapC family toxin n=2 Tax=Flavobacterium sp. TaxID=239 RepID=UPI0037BF56A5